MWLKKLKKKKLQCFLIGVMIFLSALIFASSVSLITFINGYANKYYSNDKYYNIISFNDKESSKADTLKWGKSNSKVKGVKVLDILNSGNNIYLKGEKVEEPDYNVVPLKDYKNVPFGLTKVKSLNNSKCPKKGEIWVTQLFADGYKIKLGNVLEFKINNKITNLKVTSLINDSLQPCSLLDETLFYINKENTKDFTSFNKKEITLVNTKNNEDASKVAKELTDKVNIGAAAVEKSEFEKFSTMVSSIIGGVMSLASILVFIASVFIIRFIVWNNILKEYRSIGIYKALGFSKGKIMKFYIIGYSLVAVISSILGALCSIPVINYASAKVLKYIGDFKGVNNNFSNILITIILFSLIVILNLYFVIRRTNKILPVEALRIGVTSSRKKLTKSFIKNSSSPIALAINDIFKYKKITVCIVLSLILSLSLIILFGNLNFTTLKMKDNSNIWFDVAKNNVCVSFNGINSNEKFKAALNYIKNDKRVKNYAYGSGVAVDAVKFDTKKYHMKTTLYGILSMNSYNDEEGLKTIRGNNPKSDNEVAVSTKILNDSGLSVGDYIELSINNKKANYLISGSYTTLASSGYDMRILNSEIEKYKPNYIYNEIFVNLKDSSKVKGFENDINKKYSYALATEIEPYNKVMIETMPNLITPIMFLMIAAFSVFSVIIIFSIIMINIRDNRKSFGIMKSIGFTSSQIRKRYLYRITILTVISSIFAVILNMLFSRNIIKTAMGGLDVLIISPKVIAISVISIFAIIIFLILVCSYSIKNTKPNELIDE